MIDAIVLGIVYFLDKCHLLGPVKCSQTNYEIPEITGPIAHPSEEVAISLPTPSATALCTLRRAVTEYRKWFDTCTKTPAPGEEDAAATASERLDAAMGSAGRCPHEARVEELEAELREMTQQRDAADMLNAEALHGAEQVNRDLSDQRSQIAELAARLGSFTTLRPLAEYHDDLNTVLWWHVPICEPPFVGAGPGMNESHADGSPTDCRRLIERGWLTHFSLIPEPRFSDPRRTDAIGGAR